MLSVSVNIVEEQTAKNASFKIDFFYRLVIFLFSIIAIFLRNIVTRINWGSKPTTVKKMAEELEHADNAARETAIETIAGQGLAAIELLRELIQHPKMKYIAIQALKKIHDEQAAEILIDYILGESNYYDRKLAAEALIQLGNVSVKPTISSIKKAAPDALQASYDTIMLILGALHDQTMIELVIHLLKNKPAFPEAKAIESISKFKKTIVNPLLEILDDPRCKREVIYILGKIGDGRALGTADDHLAR